LLVRDMVRLQMVYGLTREFDCLISDLGVYFALGMTLVMLALS
jgi:hypothetical protein